MKKILQLLLISMISATNVYAQLQEEWLIGSNKIKFNSTGTPTINYISEEYYSRNSIKIGGVNYSIVPYTNTISKVINHTNLNEVTTLSDLMNSTLKTSLLLTNNNYDKLFYFRKGFDISVSTSSISLASSSNVKHDARMLNNTFL